MSWFSFAREMSQLRMVFGSCHSKRFRDQSSMVGFPFLDMFIPSST